jgi:hypothetical protein
VMNQGIVIGCERAPMPRQRAFGVAHHLVRLDDVPAGALVLTRATNDQVVIEGHCELVWANADYRLWKTGPARGMVRSLQANGRP